MIVLEPLDAVTVDALRATLPVSPQEFVPTWLREGDKTVVPFEPPLEIDDEFAGRICAAFRHEGQAVLWGLSGESWLGLRLHEGLAVPVDPASVRAWHDEFFPVDVALTATTGTAAILFGRDEFGLVTGRTAFVETVLRISVEQARHWFAEYAKEMKDASHHLLDIAKKYGCQT